jgi:hypothetical protein
MIVKLAIALLNYLCERHLVLLVDVFFGRKERSTTVMNAAERCAGIPVKVDKCLNHNEVHQICQS